jgi:hypothetical protein
MARPRNTTETVTITLSTTPQVRSFLDLLVADGTYGKNVAEAAERLLAERIRELRGPAAISATLQQPLTAVEADIEPADSAP